MNLTEKSKHLALVLRHKPEEIGITLDTHGWADVPDILKGLDITKEQLDEIVNSDNKKRYSYNDDQTLIRANQGHSVPVDLELKPVMPPAVLYHGTATRFWEKIQKEGIKKMSRQYVHLAETVGTAYMVGGRHGDPFIILIDCKAMVNDGISFYLSENGVWLTDYVDPKYFILNFENRFKE